MNKVIHSSFSNNDFWFKIMMTVIVIIIMSSESEHSGSDGLCYLRLCECCCYCCRCCWSRWRSINKIITVTFWWARWRLKPPASPLFTQPFIQAQIKENIKLRVTGLCAGTSSVTCDFPAQMASNAENVSIWWRHHVYSSNALHCVCVFAHQRTLYNTFKTSLIYFIYDVARLDRFFISWQIYLASTLLKV